MTDYNSEDSVNEGDSASSSELINGADSTNNTDKDLERMTLARKESIAVAWVKGVVFLVLLATTVLVSTGVYLYTKKGTWQEQERGKSEACEDLRTCVGGTSLLRRVGRFSNERSLYHTHRNCLTN